MPRDIIVGKHQLCAGFLLAILASFGCGSEPPEAAIPPPRAEQRAPSPTPAEDGLSMAYGWSETAGTSAATLEALTKLRAGLGTPGFVVVFFTEPHDAQAIHDTLRAELPAAKLFGMQSAEAVFSPEGLHGLGSEGAVALLGFEDGQLRVGVAARPHEGAQDDHEALAAETLAAARRDAGASADEAPAAVLSAQVMGHSERYCSALNDQLPAEAGARPPMIGGNAIDSAIELGGIIANDAVYPSGFALALLYSDRAVGTYFHGGFSGRTHRGEVTRIDAEDDHVIVSIDGRPALEVYDEWTEGAYHASIPPPGGEAQIVNASVLQPLAKALDAGEGQQPHYVTLHPWLFNPDGSLNGGVSVAVGDTLHLVEGSEEALVERSGVVVRRAMAEAAIAKSKLAGGVHIYCVGAGKRLGLGQPEAAVADIVARINAQTEGAPYIGGFFGGEQGSVRGHGYFAGNLMSSMMVFAK